MTLTLPRKVVRSLLQKTWN